MSPLGQQPIRPGYGVGAEWHLLKVRCLLPLAFVSYAASLGRVKRHSALTAYPRLATESTLTPVFDISPG